MHKFPKFGVQLLKSSRAWLWPLALWLQYCQQSVASLGQCHAGICWRATQGNHENQCVHRNSEKFKFLATVVLHYIYKWGSLHQT